MGKEKINETLIGTIFAGAILLLVYWTIKKVGSASLNLITRAMGSGTQIPAKKVTNFIDKLYKNKSFIVDFVKIIQNEGGIDDFVKKTKYSADTWSSGDTVTPAVVWYGYKEFEKDENIGLDLNKNAVRVVDKLLKTNSFKSLAQKDKLSDKENEATKYLTWISSHPDSKERAEYIIEYSKGKLTDYKAILSSETWVKLKEELKL